MNKLWNGVDWWDVKLGQSSGQSDAEIAVAIGNKIQIDDVNHYLQKIKQLEDENQKLRLIANDKCDELDVKDKFLNNYHEDYVREREKSEKKSILLNLSMELVGNHDMESLVNKFWEIAPTICSCKASTLYEIVEENGQKFMRFKNVTWENQQGLKTKQFPVSGKSIAWSCALYGKQEIINDVRSDPRFDKTYDLSHNFKTSNMIVIPIKVHHLADNEDETVGVLQIMNKYKEWDLRDFNEEDRYFVELFADFISLAIQNIKYIEEMKAADEKHYQELHDAFYRSMKLLISALEERDPYTAWHSNNVNKISNEIWIEMWFTEKELEELDWSSLLHDIWKIWVSDAILNKDWKFTDEEFKIIQSHTSKWENLLNKEPWFKKAAVGAITHHEKLNWRWYPNKLKWEQIPLLWRVIAVADVFDALTSKRVYKPAWPLEKATNMLVKDSWEVFDWEVVQALLRCIEKWTVSVMWVELSEENEIVKKDDEKKQETEWNTQK